MSSRTASDVVSALTDHVRDRAAEYYPDLSGRVDVRTVRVSRRPASTLVAMQLRIGDATRSLVAKVSYERDDGDAEGADRQREERPRLVQRTPGPIKFRMEYEALSLIHRHFTALGDPRFGAIRPLDLVPELHAIVTELAELTPLRDLAPAGQGSRSIELCEVAYTNTGAWLREYQRIQPPPETLSRHVFPSDVLYAVEALGEYLRPRVDEAQLIDDVVRWAAESAGNSLPDPLPIGLSHGDFAPRNILVDEARAVTVIDTLARWRTSIFEDIAYFLASMRDGWLELLNSDPGTIGEARARCEDAFLRGYFGDAPVPLEAIRIYEVQALLDRWCSAVDRCDRASGARTRSTERLKLALIARHIRRRLRFLLLVGPHQPSSFTN